MANEDCGGDYDQNRRRWLEERLAENNPLYAKYKDRENRLVASISKLESELAAIRFEVRSLGSLLTDIMDKEPKD